MEICSAVIMAKIHAPYAHSRRTPISPFGHAERDPVTLSRSEWEPVLCAGDPILEVHIPAGGDMMPENCRASMQQALGFFPRYFPEKPFVGFACGSWILNPELDRVYRPDSNTARALPVPDPQPRRQPLRTLRRLQLFVAVGL